MRATAILLSRLPRGTLVILVSLVRNDNVLIAQDTVHRFDELTRRQTLETEWYPTLLAEPLRQG